jgi:hypothetical protein
LIPSCSWRASYVDVIVPKFDELRVVLNPWKFV